MRKMFIATLLIVCTLASFGAFAAQAKADGYGLATFGAGDCGCDAVAVAPVATFGYARSFNAFGAAPCYSANAFAVRAAPVYGNAFAFRARSGFAFRPRAFAGVSVGVGRAFVDVGVGRRFGVGVNRFNRFNRFDGGFRRGFRSGVRVRF